MFSLSTVFSHRHMHLAHTELACPQVLLSHGHIDGEVGHASNFFHHGLISRQVVWVLPIDSLLIFLIILIFWNPLQQFFQLGILDSAYGPPVPALIGLLGHEWRQYRLGEKKGC